MTAVLVLWAAAASAAPKSYVFTGKFTSNRGTLINIPLVGNTPCAGVGLSNLRIMSGPGLNASMVAPNPTPMTHPFSQLANGNKADYGCAGYVAGKKITTTGAGVGGAFMMPTHVLSKPLAGAVIHIPVATPVRQLFTSFHITGPRAAKSITAPISKIGSMWNGANTAAFHAFKKGAWATQTGRLGAMFTWCWGNPNCANVTQGTKPLIVKYSGGGNAFGGTMAYVISSGSNPSNIAIAAGAGGPIGFGLFADDGSQPTGRGYANKLVKTGISGPLWGMYMNSSMGQITMVSLYIGMNFPKNVDSNVGFPFTTMTVLARNTGTVLKQNRDTTLTAKGGDTVTAMGRRNLSLVAGGVARSNLTTGSATVVSNTPEIGQLYLPEPSRAVQLLAGALALLGIAAARRRHG